MGRYDLIEGLRLRQGLLDQGARFALAGAGVALIYLATTTILSAVVGITFQAALAIGFCLGLSAHFTLQRRFVWARQESFALSMSQQSARYLLASGAQYVLTALGTSLLPAALGLPVELVYVGLVAMLITTNFVIFRHLIFHGRRLSNGPHGIEQTADRRSSGVLPGQAPGEGGPEMSARATDPTAR